MAPSAPGLPRGRGRAAPRRVPPRTAVASTRYTVRSSRRPREQQHECHHARSQRRECPTREGQVEAEPEEGPRSGRSRPQRRRPAGVGGHAHAEHKAERRERADGVPVRERLLEAPVRARALREVDQPGQQPLGQGIRDHARRAEPKHGLGGASRPSRERYRADDERGQVQEKPLEIGLSRPSERRPGDRKPGEHGERRKAAHREARRHGARERRDQARHDERAQRRPRGYGSPQARLIEEAPGKECEDERSAEHDGRRDRARQCHRRQTSAGRRSAD